MRAGELMPAQRQLAVLANARTAESERSKRLCSNQLNELT